MSRLHKKCLISSAGFHLLLVVVLFVGPQLLASRDKPDDSQMITMVDLSKLTDGPTQTGGSATPQAPAPAPAPPAPQVTPPPAVEPPPPKPPEPVAQKSLFERLFDPEPPKPVKDKVEVADTKIKVKAQDEEGPKAPEKPKVQVAKNTVKVNPGSTPVKTPAKASDTAKAQADAAARERRAAVNRIAGNLSKGLSTGTEVSIPGPGAATYVNYGEAVRIKYTEAWIAPSDVTDDNATVKVSVTIARDGTVILAKVKTPSGSASVDRSVEETLRRVRFIAPFPEGATDAERTFIINFNLKAKRLLG